MLQGSIAIPTVGDKKIYVIGVGKTDTEAKAAAYKLRADIEAMLAIREAGWTVVIHNDYTLRGLFGALLRRVVGRVETNRLEYSYD